MGRVWGHKPRTVEGMIFCRMGKGCAVPITVVITVHAGGRFWDANVSVQMTNGAYATNDGHASRFAHPTRRHHSKGVG